MVASFAYSVEQDIYQLDQGLRQYEKKIRDRLLPDVIDKAKVVGHHYIDGVSTFQFHSVEEAMEYRYLHVPILYKMGMTTEASHLAQSTFEFIFPELHKAIQNQLNALFGENYKAACAELVKGFVSQDDQILDVAYRIKSTHSIWQKIPSLDEFEKMDLEQFAPFVNDFIGVRWKMKILNGENRYDALINGVRIAPFENLKSFRNQHLPQSSGFDCEPVIKLRYIVDGFPVELQLLGGNITAYMCAKGYSDYKAKIAFPPKKTERSEVLWKCRMGMAIFLEETHQIYTFREYMLTELIEDELDYTKFEPFELDKSPLAERNREERFPSCQIPIWKLPYWE